MGLSTMSKEESGKPTRYKNEKYDEMDDLLEYSLKLPHEVLWVENVIAKGKEAHNDWGIKYNAAQFTEDPLQCRNRIIGGRFKEPEVTGNISTAILS